MALENVYYVKVGGTRIDPETPTVTKPQIEALKVARRAMRAENPALFPTDDSLPLDVLADGVAAYLEERGPDMGAREGAAVRYAIADESTTLRAIGAGDAKEK
jgi:hypothetical protein